MSLSPFAAVFLIATATTGIISGSAEPSLPADTTQALEVLRNTMWLSRHVARTGERNFAVIAATNIAGAAAETGCDEVASAMIGKWLGK